MVVKQLMQRQARTQESPAMRAFESPITSLPPSARSQARSYTSAEATPTRFDTSRTKRPAGSDDEDAAAMPAPTFTPALRKKEAPAKPEPESGDDGMPAIRLDP
jgi:hypothetical protein